ncbi:cytochrome P450 [Schizophyllum amplum]|uniref:Cytochrome P450 n=1 Tax=Schizophyllum amplum TaxID=97359 RepID=A0A550BZ68_9AGAR|nr:cytochrome P450 [Auriculariopsis ampla]
MSSSSSLLDTAHRVLDPPDSTTSDRLQARASPNTRLRRAFGLTNTFVDADPGIHGRFVRAATRFLNRARNWEELRGAADIATQATLQDAGPGAPYADVVQEATLRFVLAGLLNIDTLSGSEEETALIRRATFLITELWVRSKLEHSRDQDRLDELNAILRQLMPDAEAFPNPLDWVIPTWETMWRVIAIALAHVVADGAARDALLAFHKDPTPSQFTHRATSDSPAVSDIVEEALRLHPPTRHIYRLVSQPSIFAHIFPVPVLRALGIPTHSARNEVADIAGLQRSPVWDSPDEWDPLRHDPGRRTAEQAATLMAFGHGRNACVARAWAPMAAGVLMAGIVRGMEVRWVVGRGAKMGGREGWDGWCVQEVEE